jgi:hypothetical protein
LACALCAASGGAELDGFFFGDLLIVGCGPCSY